MTAPQENKEYFDLPTIQRGFVWKPYQIEDLWDSLARNFPIGTFIIDDTTNNKQILDGQQRASAIAIGYGINNLFNLKGNFMRLFVDIAKPSQDSDKKFTFRLITRSHPWGYQLKDNEKTLTVADRRNALEVFEEKGIINDTVKYYNVEEKEKFFPYDCHLPVPVELFLQQDLESIKNWLRNESPYKDYIEIEHNKIKIKPIKFLDFYKFDEDNKKFVRQLKIPTKGLLEIYENIFKPHKNEFKKKKTDKNKLEQKIIDEFKKFNNDNSFYELQNLTTYITNIKNYQLVFSNLTNSKLNLSEDIIKSKNIIKNSNEQILNEEEKTEDIEIIFQRLNKGGTPISEDDLTFSLFKSSLGTKNEAKKPLNGFIDNCEELITPSRMFRLAYLLWEQSKNYSLENSKQYELAYQRIKYKLAKNDFNKPDFKNFLNDHFTKDAKENYFAKFKEVFLYSNENKNGLPYPLFIQLCKSAPELVFLMMYRLNIKNDYEQVQKNSENRNLMIGFLLGLYWFFKGEKERSYKSLLNTIWPLVSFATFENCWSTELLQRCKLMYDNYELIDNYIFDKLAQEKDGNNQLYEKIDNRRNDEKYLSIFKDKILYNNDLVLYAQREYLSLMFPEKDIFSLEDNSVPYDFDHICPSSYRRRKKINRKIKDLLDDIGNFRAWPYELNRSDQDNSISDKFNFEENKRSFNNYHINKKSEVKKYSFVNWTYIANYTFDNLTNNTKESKNETIRLCNNIQNRSYRIYKQWYDLIISIYKQNKIGERLKYNYDNVIDTLNNTIRNNDKYNYIWISNNEEDQIMNNNIIVYICKNKVIAEKNVDELYENEFTFTLASYSQASFDHLCNEIVQTIDEYEKKKTTKN